MKNDFLLQRVLKHAERNGITYAIFKSSVNTSAALAGYTDLDILVDENSIQGFRELLLRYKFLPTQAAFSVSNPYRYGYLGFCTSANRLVYLDIMTRVVIGIDRARQVQSLELARIIMEKAKYDEFGLKCIGTYHEVACLHSRLVAKTSFTTSIFDYIRYVMKARIPYSAENRYLIDALKSEDTSLPDCCTGNIASFKAPMKMHYKFKEYRMVRSYLESQSVYGHIERNLRYFAMSLYALLFTLNKTLFSYYFPLLFAYRRTLESPKLCMITGIDGSGKSTISRALVPCLSWKLDTYRIYLGAGEGGGSVPRRLVAKASTALKKLTIRRRQTFDRFTAPDERPSASSRGIKLLKVVWAFIVACEKHRKFYQIVQLRRKNAFILVDRYPSMSDSGTFDSPLLMDYLESSNAILRYLANYERSVYSLYQSLDIDLCVELDASLGLVQARGENFNKHSYSDRQQARLQALDTLPIRHKITIDASLPVDVILAEVQAELFNKL